MLQLGPEQTTNWVCGVLFERPAKELPLPSLLWLSQHRTALVERDLLSFGR
jgi:hypothetical protein